MAEHRRLRRGTLITQGTATYATLRAAEAEGRPASLDRIAPPLAGPTKTDRRELQARDPSGRDSLGRAPRRPASDLAIGGAGLIDPGAPAADGRGWPAPARTTTTVWFDHTDLAHYFADNRTPTGIQRVEIELYRAARRRLDTGSGPRAGACAFDPERRCWVTLPREAFDRLCGVPSDPGADPDGPAAEPLADAAWAEAVALMQAAILVAPPVPFRRDDMLVTVGATWWVTDYLVFVRHLQQERGVLYAAFVHDCIPLIMPETCAAGLVADFRDWFAAAMHATDLTFANSRCTAQDIIGCAHAAGLPAPAPHVVRLDAQTGQQQTGQQQAGQQQTGQQQTGQQQTGQQQTGHQPGGNLQGGDGAAAPRHAAAVPPAARLAHARLGVRRRFALFVATIEARKDHIFVFRCWQELIARYGADAVPDLLCVGKPGWLVEFTLNWLQVTPQLAGKVRLLGTVSDDDLAALYATAEFCVYNSHYEGWGLPVTESLSHGRVPMVPHHSSLPEAGGTFAAYFEPGQPESFIAQATRLLDPGLRAGLERRIRARFRPRSWAAVLEQILTIAGRAPARARPLAAGIPLQEGGIYVFGRRSATTRPARARNGRALLPGALARFGTGWWLPEEWGCWSRSPQAHLLFSLASDRPARPPAADDGGPILDGDGLPPAEPRSYFVYVLLRGGPAAQRVEMEAGGVRTGPITLQPHRRELLRLSYNDVVATGGDVLIGLSAEPYSLADHTDGRDPRRIGFGLEALAIIDSRDVEARANILEMAVMPT